MSAPTATLYEPGYLIAGKYELESLLGQGGMGAVWKARNVALDSRVAIKVLRATGDSPSCAGACCKKRALRPSSPTPRSSRCSTSARPSLATPSS